MLEKEQVIGNKYRIISLLGAGAFGEAFLSEDTLFHKQVVIKISRTIDNSIIRRFQEEAWIISTIQHPNIANILDYGKLDDGGFYLVTEYVKGHNLSLILKKGPLTVSQALTVLHAITQALVVVHSKNIIHRDIKPSNIIIPGDFSSLEFENAKLVDFGVFGKLLILSKDNLSTTVAGEFFGTPYYMSPEQLRSEPQSTATDVWALGVILFEMLFGYPPFKHVDQGLLQFIYDATQSEVKIPSQKEIPFEIISLIRLCLQKDPNKRLPSSSILLEEIRKLPYPIYAKTFSIAPIQMRVIWWPFFLMILIIILLFCTLLWRSEWNIPSQATGFIIGIFLIIGGLTSGFVLRKLFQKLKIQIQKDIIRLFHKTKSYNNLTDTLALQLDELISKCNSIDQKILGMTVMQMVKEYKLAKESNERQSALMNVAQLLEKLMTRLSPWYVRHEKLIVFVISIIGIISGILTATISIIKIIKLN